jgi:uncharacterized protein DUF6644
MNLLPLFQWFEATMIGTSVRESLWMFPVIECVHLLALALLGGTVLVVDLRLLGFGLTGEPVDQLARKAHPWLLGAWLVIVATGILMFLSEAIKCYYSPPFSYKIGLLVIASIYTFTVRRRVTRKLTPPRPRLTALASLTLWLGVAFAGRWIAFY